MIILYGVIMASGIDDYRITRILSFVNPELVDANATYQVTQSKIAIGAGGTDGIGMFVQGSFSQLGLCAAGLYGLYLCHHRRGVRLLGQPGRAGRVPADDPAHGLSGLIIHRSGSGRW